MMKSIVNSISILIFSMWCVNANAVGVAAGTPITNTVTINYNIGATPGVAVDTDIFQVQEVIDVDVSWQDAANVVVSPASTQQVLTFLLTNTGNGIESFSLQIDNSIVITDDFDPTSGVIYLDGNGNGVFDGAPTDPVYVLGVNDPLLDANGIDTQIVFLVSDIPAAATVGQTGESQLTANSLTAGAAGAIAGTYLNTLGDGGIDAVVGTSQADDDTRNGTAYLAELQHKSERADANVYFRRQAASFGLEQQSANNDGAKRYGVDARYKVSDSININSEVYRDEVLTNENKRTVATLELEKSLKQYEVAAGVAYAKDKIDGQDDNDSVLATGRASRYLIDNKLRVRADTEIELTSDNSIDHPTRLIGGADYRLNQVTELFAEHEYTQGEDQDTNTSRVGTRLTPWNQATINSSFEQQSSEDGQRLFSNLGFVQGWQYNENLQLDFSLDRSDTLRDPGGQAFNSNTALSSGTITDDFTAASVGANYVEDKWSSSSRVEYRTSDSDIQRSLFMGFFREQNTGLGMSLDLQMFDTDRRSGADETQADINYSVAYRPSNSAFTVLNRFDLNYDSANSEDSRIRTRKAVNNLNLNYTVDGKHQFGAHWGIKYTLDNIDSEEYDGVTQLLGFQYLYDLHERVDLSLHGDVLYSTNADNYRYSLGPSIGLNVYKNMWLSVGYNLDGFEDEDFSSAEYTANGPYVKMRLKFDKSTVKGLLNK